MIRRQLVLFSIAGTLGFVVDAGVLYAAIAAGTGFYAGRVVSFLCAAFSTWLFNRRFTFPHADPAASWWSQWLRYLYAMSFGAVVNYLAYVVVLHALARAWWAPLAGVAVGSLSGLAVNFVLARQWVFKSG
jgi:putative flippase GtrA